MLGSIGVEIGFNSSKPYRQRMESMYDFCESKSFWFLQIQRTLIPRIQCRLPRSVILTCFAIYVLKHSINPLLFPMMVQLPTCTNMIINTFTFSLPVKHGLISHTPQKTHLCHNIHQILIPPPSCLFQSIQ